MAAVTTMQLAFEFRQQFQRDVVVDMYCYRRHGHNEGDEPRFTQPLMYSAIEDHPPISDIFFGHLVKFGDITPDEVRAFRAKFEGRLNDALQKSKVSTKAIVPAIRNRWLVPRCWIRSKRRCRWKSCARLAMRLRRNRRNWNSTRRSSAGCRAATT